MLFSFFSNPVPTFPLIPSAPSKTSPSTVYGSPSRGLMTKDGVGDQERTATMEVEKWKVMADSFLQPPYNAFVNDALWPTQ